MEGWIYVFRNPGVPGLVKIGYTTNDPEQRAKEIDHTGVPHPFLIDYLLRIDEPRSIEQQVHQALSHKRVRKEREWFNCTTEEAIVAIKQVAGSRIIQEIYKAADRAKAEARHKREIAEREAEQQLRNEEAEVRQRFKQQLETSFAPWPFWRYWVVCSLLCFFTFVIILPKSSGIELLWLSVIGGAAVPLFLRDYIEKKRKQSRAYTSIENQRDVQLTEIRSKLVACPSCNTNIRFDRKTIMLAESKTCWTCPNCKVNILSPWASEGSRAVVFNHQRDKAIKLDQHKSISKRFSGSLVIIIIILAAIIIPQVARQQQKPVAPVEAPAAAPATIASKQEHFDKIRRAHPDFEKYRDNGALKAWIQKQPGSLRDSLLKVYSKGDADSVIALFNEFKKDDSGPAVEKTVPAPSHRRKQSGRSVTYTPKNKIQTPLPKHEMEDNPRQEQDWKPREDAVKIPKADVSVTRSPEKQSQTPMENVKPSVDADQRYRRIKGIVLMDGNVIEGQIISMNTDVVKIRAKEGNILSYDFKKEVQRFITE
jgi:hypothetical protein